VPSHVLQHVELNKLLLDNNKLSSLPEDMKLMTCLEVGARSVTLMPMLNGFLGAPL
jgi:hypothetical protein